MNKILYAQCLVVFRSSLTAELPLEFPDGTTPVTCRVSVYDSSTDRKVGVGASLMKACVPPLAAGSLYMEEVQVKVRYFQCSQSVAWKLLYVDIIIVSWRWFSIILISTLVSSAIFLLGAWLRSLVFCFKRYIYVLLDDNICISDSKTINTVLTNCWNLVSPLIAWHLRS